MASLGSTQSRVFGARLSKGQAKEKRATPLQRGGDPRHSVLPDACPLFSSNPFPFFRYRVMTRLANPESPLLPGRSGSLSAQFAIDVSGKFGEKIQQCAIPGLSQHRPSSLGKRVARMRLPGCRNQSPSERASIQRQLRTQLPLALIVSNKIPLNRVSRTRPKPAAPALIVTRLVFQLGISQCRQRVR